MDKRLEALCAALQIRIENLEKQLNIPIQENEENIRAVTPYTDTKTAYIDDTEVTFADVPQGNLTVYFESNGGYPNYNVSRNGDRVTVSFEPLEYIGTVTISVQ